MLRLISLLVVLAVAGVWAGVGFGSATTVPCTAKRKTHCVKTRPRTVTVVHRSTVTHSVTTAQTVTATQTQTVTVTAPTPVPTPLPGAYSGNTETFGSLSFLVGGSPLSVQQFSFTEVDSTCIDTPNSIYRHPALYNVAFPGPLALDAKGHFAASQTLTDADGDTMTVTLTGQVSADGYAQGTVSETGKTVKNAADGYYSQCDASSKWRASKT
jgi:hypothetical protein